MQVFNLSDDTPLPPAAQGGAWLIGNFDGVHKGHQAMIAELQSISARVNVLTFSPHPRAFLIPLSAPALITAPAEKLALLAAAGVYVVVTRRFDAVFAAHNATAFIETILKGQLGAELVAVGADFRFGAKRQGDVALLQQHLRVHVFAPFCDETKQAYSSTRIRQALAEGDTMLAERLLGRPLKPAT